MSVPRIVHASDMGVPFVLDRDGVRVRRSPPELARVEGAIEHGAGLSILRAPNEHHALGDVRLGGALGADGAPVDEGEQSSFKLSFSRVFPFL